jgi:hemolysin III
MDIQQLKEKIDQLSQELNTMRDSIEVQQVQRKLEHLKHEMANSVTHGIGVVFFLIAVPVLMAYCVRYSTRDYTVCAGIFAFGLMITYLSSTLYHSFHHAETKKILRIFDHVSIFLLIGASYTPIVYHYLPHDFAVPFLIALWVIVGIGSLFKIFFTGRFRLSSTMAYVALGFMSVFIFKPITANMSTFTVWLLVGGGISYAAGVPFYILKRLKYNHAIWHVFVFAGSVMHYFVILRSAV